MRNERKERRGRGSRDGYYGSTPLRVSLPFGQYKIRPVGDRVTCACDVSVNNVAS